MQNSNYECMVTLPRKNEQTTRGGGREKFEEVVCCLIKRREFLMGGDDDDDDEDVMGDPVNKLMMIMHGVGEKEEEIKTQRRRTNLYGNLVLVLLQVVEIHLAGVVVVVQV